MKVLENAYSKVPASGAAVAEALVRHGEMPLRALRTQETYKDSSLRQNFELRSFPAASAAPTDSSIQYGGQSSVAILLCTMRGQRFLAEQLDSIAAQTYPHWNVWVSDDGSKDGTYAVLDRYKTEWSDDRISIHSGPEEGVTANFLSLTCKADISADYYAYADQDDIWETDKLARAIRWLKEIPADIPALYCSRTRLVDEQGNEIGFSSLFTRQPSFANALVQNIGGGNTMVFNAAARHLLCEFGEDVNVVTHDWWAYMAISGCGGKVYYDPYPSVRYRQHGNNLVGSNLSWSAKLVRSKMLLKGRYRDWNDRNTQVLLRLASRLTPENRRILEKFCAARQSTLLQRLVGIKRSGIYRQTLPGNLGLMVAAILNKL